MGSPSRAWTIRKHGSTKNARIWPYRDWGPSAPENYWPPCTVSKARPMCATWRGIACRTSQTRPSVANRSGSSEFAGMAAPHAVPGRCEKPPILLPGGRPGAFPHWDCRARTGKGRRHAWGSIAGSNTARSIFFGGRYRDADQCAYIACALAVAREVKFLAAQAKVIALVQFVAKPRHPFEERVVGLRRAGVNQADRGAADVGSRRIACATANPFQVEVPRLPQVPALHKQGDVTRQRNGRVGNSPALFEIGRAKV